MSDPTVFDKTQETPSNSSSTSPYEDMLKDLKNEKGEQKYKNIEEALKALKHSQEYIPTLHQKLDALNTEKAALETKFEKMLSIEEKLDALLNKSAKEENDDVNPPLTETPKEPTFDTDLIDKMIQQRMSQARIQEVELTNLQKVSHVLEELYGDKAFEYIASKAQENGMNVEELKVLASRNPKVALKLLDVNEKPSVSSPSVSSYTNSASLRPTENSQIKRNDKSLFGGTSSDLKNEVRNSREMVEQLEKNGISMSDLSDPRTYFKVFN